MGQLLLPKQFEPGVGNPRVAPDENLWEINWSHPDAEGLLFYAIGLRDMVSGHLAIPVRGYGSDGDDKVARSHGRSGLELRSFTGSSNGFEWPNCTEFARVNGTKLLTVIASVSTETLKAEAKITGVPRARTGFAAPATLFSLGANGSGTELRVRFSEPDGPSVVLNTTLATFFAADKIPVVVGVTKNDTTAMRFYKDGAFVETVVDAENSDFIDWPAQYSLFGLGPDVDKTTWSTDGALQYHAWWLKDKDAGEHKAFYANPYALLKPRVPTLYYTVSAAPGPLNLNRLSALHYEQHYEPLSMGE